VLVCDLRVKKNTNSFPGLISPDYGDATSLSGTTPAKTGEPQFHM
jgi:hypothetical protein